jgi:hypothetical protein
VQNHSQNGDNQAKGKPIVFHQIFEISWKSSPISTQFSGVSKASRPFLGARESFVPGSEIWLDRSLMLAFGSVSRTGRVSAFVFTVFSPQNNLAAKTDCHNAA